MFTLHIKGLQWTRSQGHNQMSTSSVMLLHSVKVPKDLSLISDLDWNRQCAFGQVRKLGHRRQHNSSPDGWFPVLWFTQNPQQCSNASATEQSAILNFCSNHNPQRLTADNSES